MVPDLDYLATQSFDILRCTLRCVVPKDLSLRVHMLGRFLPDKSSRYQFKAESMIEISADGFAKDCHKYIATIVGFKIGDGTGSRKDHYMSEIIAKYTPRDKHGFSEIGVSIGSAVNYNFFPNVTSLDIVTLEMVDGSKKIKHYETFSTPAHIYQQLGMYGLPNDLRGYEVPPVRLTFLKEHGNPHAVIAKNRAGFDFGEAIQLAAFIPLAEESELNKVLISNVQNAKKIKII